jgi:hypothetical protein
MDMFGYSRSTPSSGPRGKDIDLFLGATAIERKRINILNKDGASLLPVLDVTFSKEGPSKYYLGSGWYSLEKEFVWTNGHRSTFRFKRPTEQGSFRLRLMGRPLIMGQLLPWQRIGLSINGETQGQAKINGFSVIEVDLPWDLISQHDLVTLELECPDAARPRDLDPAKTEDRLLGFALEKMIVYGTAKIEELTSAPPAEVKTTAVVANGMALSELMHQFESIGENCEFGLVQRHCNVDPLGLLRFSSTPLPKLLEALNVRFEGIGKKGKVEVQISPNGTEYMVLDKRFGFLYHAWVLVGEGSPKEIEVRELRRLPLLVRKLVEQLTIGEKIFVYHGLKPLSEDDARKLSAAMRQYGPTTLLWVELADDQHAPGTVEQIEPGLIKGYMDRLAPGKNAYDFSLDCWITLCSNAYGLWRPS